MNRVIKEVLFEERHLSRNMVDKKLAAERPE